MGNEDHKGFELKPATAIGYSVVCNLGGDRQFTAQCFVGEDEPVEEINRRIDKVLAVTDRLKAKYDLRKLENEFEEVGRHLRNFLSAIPVAEQSAKHQEAVLKTKLAAQEEARKEVYDQGYAAHRSVGRKGSYEPSGALKGRLNGMDLETQKTRDAITALPNDLIQHRSQTAGNILKYQDDMKKRRLEINDLRKMAGLEPYTLFMDEQEQKIE